MGHSRARGRKKKKERLQRRGGGGICIKKNPTVGARRDVSAGNERPGEEDKGGVELDISVSCQRLVHGCGMLMSEVSLGFFSLLPLFLYPHLPHPPPPPSSFPRSPSVGGGKTSGSIADPTVRPVLYLSEQAVILSALNVIYSERLPKSTQRDPLTQRSGLSHSHLSLSLSFLFSASNARTHAHAHGPCVFTHGHAGERARSPRNTRMEKENPPIGHTMI